MYVLEQDPLLTIIYRLETACSEETKTLEIKEEMDALYTKEDFSDADGIKAGELA